MAGLSISPLIEREFSRAIRRKGTDGVRFLIGVLAVACTMLAVIAVDDFGPRVGKPLFFLLFGLGIYQGTQAGIALSVGLFSEERRNQTLGLIYLSGVRPWELFVAKLGGPMVAGVNRILIAIPCLMVPVSLLQLPVTVFGTAVLTIFCWFLFVAALNLFVSILFTEENVARMVADGSLAVLAGFLPAVNAINKLLTGVAVSPEWLILSPAYGPWQFITMVFGSGAVDRALAGNLVSLGYSSVLLAGASVLLRKVWRWQVSGVAAERRWIGLFVDRLRERQRLRARTLLERNPYAWLIAKDYRPVLAAWAAFGVIGTIWLVGLWQWSKFWLLPINFWATCIVLQEVVRWLIDYLAARQIGEDRATGGLELLLTSGLSVEAMVAGQDIVFRRYIRPLYAVLIGVHLIFFAAGFFVRAWTGYAWVSYVMVWLAVVLVGPWMAPRARWTAFWVSLHTGRPGFALRRRLVAHGGYLGIWIQAYFHFEKLVGFPYGSRVELMVVLGLGAVFLLLLVLNRAFSGKLSVSLRPKILAELREVAQHPVPELADPELKAWSRAPVESFYHEKKEKIMV